MIKAYACQVDHIAGQLQHNGMNDISTDDLRSLSGSLQMTLDIVYREIYRRMELEQEALPKVANYSGGGLLDLLKPSNPEGAA
ncbi:MULTISPECIES: hypothetical protein [Bradyrhizobium]|uniref:hypothetical protein n=1 Tax=Bradyrhizobium TaxID=374 RepID=UPI0020A0CA0D|nr:hypothetical protein [Bradyrhizobium elkanii]MCP1969917.1 hypothetical protein [Bradyrhizobium elkanii]MCS4108575.1 hypothetical protein [Bradyrhizobium elkanii]